MLMSKGQTAYQRWELSSLANPLGQATSKASPHAIEEARREAQQAGYASGMAAARLEIDRLTAELQAERAQQQQRTTLLLNACMTGMDRLRDRVAKDISLLALDWAEAIVQTEIDLHPDRLAQLIVETIEHYPGMQGPRTLTLHPDTLHSLGSDLQSALAAQGWRLASSPSVERMSCHISTGDLIAHGGVPERLAMMRERIASICADPTP